MGEDIEVNRQSATFLFSASRSNNSICDSCQSTANDFQNVRRYKFQLSMSVYEGEREREIEGQQVNPKRRMKIFTMRMPSNVLPILFVCCHPHTIAHQMAQAIIIIICRVQLLKVHFNVGCEWQAWRLLCSPTHCDCELMYGLINEPPKRKRRIGRSVLLNSLWMRQMG